MRHKRLPSYGPDSYPLRKKKWIPLTSFETPPPKNERPPFRNPTILISIPVCGDFLAKRMRLNTQDGIKIQCCMVIPRESEEEGYAHQGEHGGCDSLMLRGRLWRTATGRLRLEAHEEW